jgi:YopX protein
MLFAALADILHCRNNEVTWDQELTGFSPFNDYDSDCSIYFDAKDAAMIGNIYENPELLNDAKKAG